MGFLFGEAMNFQFFQTMENNISEVLGSSMQQYRDYIIDLYGVKASTMSNSKCVMPSLSCLLSFYTIPISLFFISKIFLFSSLPSFFMYACIHKV